MARVKSQTVGKASGRVGNIYFRTVRGRTIQCDLPTVNSAVTRAPQSVARQNVFGLVNRFAKNHASSISQSFDKTKYGSQRNGFVKQNYYHLSMALSSLSSMQGVTDEQIENAVTAYATENPTAIYRVKKAGTPTVYLTGAWDDAANPMTATVYVAGSKVTSSAAAISITTGDALKIVGDNLNGSLSFGIVSDLGDAVSTVSQSSAVTEVSVSDTEITAKFAASQNGKYLVSIKLGDVVLVSLKNEAYTPPEENAPLG